MGRSDSDTVSMSTLPLYKAYIPCGSLLIWPDLLLSCLVIRTPLSSGECRESWAERKRLEGFQNLFTIGSTGLTGRHNVSMFTGGDYIKYELGKEKEVLKIIFMPRDVS